MKKLVPQQPAESRALGIQVSGFQPFERGSWRIAMLHYLAGMEKGKDSVTHRPKLRFELGDARGITLRLNQAEGVYYAYGSVRTGKPPVYARIYTLQAECTQQEVHAALRAFVEKNSLRKLVIRLSGTERIVFWKKSGHRGFLGVSAFGIPEGY